MRNFIRAVLWIALVGTAAMFLLLTLLLPSDGFVAGLIEFVTALALSAAGMMLWAWGDAEETEKDWREKLADADRLRAGVYSPAVEDMFKRFDATLQPGSCPEFQHLLKCLAASRS